MELVATEEEEFGPVCAKRNGGACCSACANRPISLDPMSVTAGGLEGECPPGVTMSRKKAARVSNFSGELRTNAPPGELKETPRSLAPKCTGGEVEVEVVEPNEKVLKGDTLSLISAELGVLFLKDCDSEPEWCLRDPPPSRPKLPISTALLARRNPRPDISSSSPFRDVCGRMTPGV